MTNVNQPNPLPETGFVRLPLILQVIPVSKSTWWAGVKSGRFPQSVKLGPRTTAWRVGDIRQLVERLGDAESL
jgi:predicted DNA-binding transcriptional regulator AlpA